MYRRPCTLLAAAAVAFSASSAAAADKQMTAVRVDTGPSLDGVLDDAAWQGAVFVSDFAQLEPTEGAAPTRQTDVAFVYDGEHLYVGARMHARGPDDIQTVVTRRDESGSAERIIVSIDPFLDRRTAYSFAVTAAGVRVDWLHTDDNAHARDMSFNPVWEAEVHIGADGWTAEMKIPFSQLRFPNRDVQTWGVNINRYRPQDNEDLFWIVVPKGTVAWSSHFGQLLGIEKVEPSARIEVLPYVAGVAFVDEGDAPNDLDGDAGIDLKMGLGPSLTLDATFNPDFGQVEADPAVVNLSAFETRFPERRPFFIEGNGLLQGLGPTYYYSRRFGGAPRGLNNFSSSPSPTRILGAAKVTGRTRSNTSIGALAAVTSTTPENTFDPLQAFSVLRLQQELGANASIVGLSFASMYRSVSDDDTLDDGTPLQDLLTRQAYTGGGDWRLRFGDGGQYEVQGHVGGSVVNGEKAAIQLVQTSSTHYFQRPDQEHVTVDPDQRTLAGWTAGLLAQKRSGKFRWFAHHYYESPGFELNDTGLLSSADDISLEAGADYLVETPTDSYRSWNIGISGDEQWNFGGDRHPGRIGGNGQLTFPSYWSVGTNVHYFFPGMDDDATRGGPLMELGPQVSTNVSVNNRHGAKTSVSASVHYLISETRSSGFGAAASLSFVPHDRVKVQLSPSWFRTEQGRQYITTLPGGRAETFDNRYVFGHVKLSTIAVQTRIQVAVTPNLAVEIYAEPFASSANYTAFGELLAPKSRDLVDYTIQSDDDSTVMLSDGTSTIAIDQPDFTALSLRSTAVVRWEFLRGSTLFAVWQQNRSDSLSDGSRVNAAQLGDAVNAPGAHTFVLKITYWWPVD